MIRQRLLAPTEVNVAITFDESRGQKDSFEIDGRGELQLGVLIETMRREEFELTYRPHVLFKMIDGSRHEPDRRGDCRC